MVMLASLIFRDLYSDAGGDSGGDSDNGLALITWESNIKLIITNFVCGKNIFIVFSAIWR